MSTFLSLISNYHDYIENLDTNKLFYLCLVKLLPLVKKDLTIEELIDAHDVHYPSLSYPLVIQLVSKLQPLHLPEILEPLVLIYDYQLKDYMDQCVKQLINNGILTSCCRCFRFLLINPTYYYVCKSCDSNIYHQSQYTYPRRRSCCKCWNQVTYYLNTDEVKFKIFRTSSYDLDNNQGVRDDLYGRGNIYRCSKKCRSVDDCNLEAAFKIYQKYTQLYNS